MWWVIRRLFDAIIVTNYKVDAMRKFKGAFTIVTYSGSIYRFGAADEEGFRSISQNGGRDKRLPEGTCKIKGTSDSETSWVENINPEPRNGVSLVICFQDGTNWIIPKIKTVILK